MVDDADAVPVRVIGKSYIRVFLFYAACQAFEYVFFSRVRRPERKIAVRCGILFYNFAPGAPENMRQEWSGTSVARIDHEFKFLNFVFGYAPEQIVFIGREYIFFNVFTFYISPRKI